MVVLNELERVKEILRTYGLKKEKVTTINFGEQELEIYEYYLAGRKIKIEDNHSILEPDNICISILLDSGHYCPFYYKSGHFSDHHASKLFTSCYEYLLVDE